MKNLTNLLGPDLRIKSVTKEAINNLRLSGLVAYSRIDTSLLAGLCVHISIEEEVGVTVYA